MREIHGVPVFGVEVDPETRCAHYDTELDVVALRFDCCDRFFPCFQCHAAVADHEASVVPRDECGTVSVLCGRCGHLLTVSEYLDCDSTCSDCGGDFNPGCARHADRYFEL
ncbi:CHY zinc finger protein [Haloarchaeobius sp. DFWS5]|uniref:CHY zinc finger protein n=1 Tax=Haloarchaeobius sp. DFWS5 TaxID=3446114 RepID=UPI003EC10C4E